MAEQGKKFQESNKTFLNSIKKIIIMRKNNRELIELYGSIKKVEKTNNFLEQYCQKLSSVIIM